MPTVAEKRAWLNEHRPDLDVPQRGRLSPDLETAWADGNASLDGGITAEDFPDGLEPAEREPETPLEPERAPGTPRSRRRARTPQQRVRGLFGGKDDKPARGKPKPPKHKRVPVDHLVSRVWEGLARVAQPLSLPVSRCLQVQSPVAGMILEDVVRDTVVDRALQPIARFEEKGEKVLALVAPPLLVATLEQTAALEAAGAITPQQAMMRRAFQVPMLRESLRIWLEVAGPKVEEAARREREYQETFGHTIDELMNLFFGVTVYAEQMGEEAVPPEPAMAS